MMTTTVARTSTLSKPNTRRTVTLYAICWIIGIGILLHWWGGVASADTHNGHYTVQSGDTLWNIAQSHMSSMDTRVAVDELMRVNHISQANIYPGEYIVLPQK
jgi:hypothetical protein